MNSSAKFQLYPLYVVVVFVFVFFVVVFSRKFNLSVAMATNQIQRIAQK